MRGDISFGKGFLSDVKTVSSISTFLDNDPKFILEANNIFNTCNVTSTITAGLTFAALSSVLEGRLLQIGIRADW